MVSYYISYGEPESRFNWRTLLLILLGLLALAILAGIAYGIFLLATGDEDTSFAAPIAAASAIEAEEEAAGSGGAVPLTTALPSLHLSDTNTVFLVDVSKSISDGGNLPLVQQSLLDVVLPYVDESGGAENSRAALMTFTREANHLVPLATLDDVDAQQDWLAAVADMETEDQPAFIYDAVGAAHQELADLDDGDRVNVIVLLTDGADGGYQIIDLAAIVPCPDDVGASAGQVCSPLAGADRGDETDGYLPFDPGAVEACPAEFAAPDGKACVAVSSATSQQELIATLQSGEVPNLMVHTIGFGQEADQGMLRLLAAAGELQGQYVYADK